MSDTRDIRTTASHLVARSLDDSGEMRVEGYALTFNQLSQDLGGFVEVIQPTALDNVDLANTVLLYGHDFNNILARASTNSLTLTVDDIGLKFEATLPDTQLGRDVNTNVMNGNLNGCSFLFTTKSDSWSKTDDGMPLHVIEQFDSIPEVTITSNPAYLQTSVEIKRHLDQTKGNQMAQDIKPDQATEEAVSVESAPTQEREADTTDTATDAKTDTEAVDPADIEKLQAEYDQLSKAIKALQEAQADDTESDEEAEPTPQPQEKEARSMPQVINKESESQARSFVAALKGEKRDNVTTNAEGAILVPKDILDIQAVPTDASLLSAYVHRIAVSHPSGTIPVLTKGRTRLLKAGELEERPELAKAKLKAVDYRTDVYAGTIGVSYEMLQDYPGIEGLIKSQLQDIKDQTEDALIGDVVKTFKPVAATSLGDLKSEYNKLAGYKSDRVIVVTTSAYNQLDGLTDAEGRYQLQSNVASASGTTLFGAPVVIVPDTTLGADGEAKAFIGSLKHGVAEALQLDTVIDWEKQGTFSRVLSVAMRLAIVKADEDAGVFVDVKLQSPTKASKAG